MNQEKIIQAIADVINKKGTDDFGMLPWCKPSDLIAELAAAIAPHLEGGVNTTKIREAFARYVDTEGCSCCRDSEGHEVAEKELAELLKPLPYVDSSGWDWDKPA